MKNIKQQFLLGFAPIQEEEPKDKLPVLILPTIISYNALDTLEQLQLFFPSS